MNHVDNAPARLRELAGASRLELFRELDSSPKGLLEAEAVARLARHGDNRVRPEPETGLARRAAQAVRSPFVGLLTVLGVVFVVLGDARGAVTVAVMVTLSVAMRAWTQTRSERAVGALRERVSVTCTVRRRSDDGAEPLAREVPAADLVPGDVVLLGPGDVVAADVRVLRSQDLAVDQSGLSGEALPVAKPGAPDTGRRGGKPDRSVVDSPTLCLAGTRVVSGGATALVLATGSRTYLGCLAERPGPRAESTFEQGVRRVGVTLIQFMVLLVPVVLLVSGTVSGDWARAVTFAVAVAVGLTPEMLPVIVATNLARGAVRLARRKVIVKRLNAIQDLGSADVLCVDKTGTLTEDRVAYAHSIDPDGDLDGTAAEYAHLALRFQITPLDRLDRAVEAQLRAGGREDTEGPVADPDDVLADAIYRHVDEIGFDPYRRRSTVVLGRGDREHVLIMKGDPDVVLQRCVRAGSADGMRQITAADRERFRDLTVAHARHGMRILAVAVEHRAARIGDYTESDEQGLTLIGFIGFVDPVGPEVGAAVAGLAVRGVQVKILTGDSEHVARYVAGQAGLRVGRVVLGSQVETASPARVRSLAERGTVFARLTPDHKARIVAALQRGGHSVGFVGDGANDAPALRMADVGIAADSATDVAKDAADLILLEKNLGVLAAGIVEGRRALGNTLKYVHVTASSNLGNVLSVLAASVFLPFVPMLPIQLVAQNLLYDAAQLALPWDRVGHTYLSRPRRWDAAGLVRFMLVFGPLSSLFDLLTFLVLWRGFGAVGEPALFRTGWFVEGLCSQLLVVLLLRTAGPVWRASRTTRPARAVALAGLASAVVGLALPVGPWAAALGMTPLPAGYLVWLIGVLLAYGAAVELVKRRYGRHHALW
jgi:P-type Mg2+ transporter